MSSASRLAACFVTASSSARRETVGCSAATARSTKPNDGRIASPPASATAATSRSLTQRLAAVTRMAKSGSLTPPTAAGRSRRRDHGGDGARRHAGHRPERRILRSAEGERGAGGEDEAVAGAEGVLPAVDRRFHTPLEPDEGLLAVHLVQRDGAARRSSWVRGAARPGIL